MSGIMSCEAPASHAARAAFTGPLVPYFKSDAAMRILVGEEAAEYQRLYADYAAAMAYAAGVLKSKGMDSEDFRQADAAAGELWVRLRELRGITGKHWMA
jgi:hypothetical protein